MLETLRVLLESNPIIIVIIMSFLGAIVLWLIYNSKIRWLKVILTALIFIWLYFYFGGLFLLSIFLILSISFLGGCKLLTLSNEGLIGITVFLFILLEIYILSSLVINPKIGLMTIYLFCLVVFLYRKDMNKEIFKSLAVEIKKFFASLNVLDIGLIMLCFILGSLPQSHWDAVHANLYNAKWYIENNSFAFLPESVSSLYPQGAIAYYSLFYQLGGLKGLQISYILPLIFLLVVFKKIQQRLNYNYFSRGISYSLLVTPIVIFQSSNGYYDLLVLSVILTALYIIFFDIIKTKTVSFFLSAFLIGVAGGMKYFPILFLGLPILIYTFSNKLKLSRDIFVIGGGILVSFLPLGIWMARAFYFTGSPVFPFFQNAFPTPGFWPLNDVLENNFMIKTPINEIEWIFLGSIVYPVFTFINSELFIEATVGYSGLGYVVLLILEISAVLIALKNIQRKKCTRLDFYLIYSLAVFILVGFITRYYRYLWPYQMISALLVIGYIPVVINMMKIKKLYATYFISCLLLANLLITIYYYSYIPVIYNQLFKPNYYFSNYINDSLLAYFNLDIDSEKAGKTKVLDASTSYLGRFHFRSRVYQCSWYWIGVLDILSKADKDNKYGEEIIGEFDYVITDKKTFSEGLCKNLLVKNQNGLKEVFKDSNYTLYKVKQIW